RQVTRRVPARRPPAQRRTNGGMSLSDLTSDAPTRRPSNAGLHPTGLIVAVVGLLASVGAFWVAGRESRDSERERVEDVSDEVANGVDDVLRDIEGLVSGVEGTLIATQE